MPYDPLPKSDFRSQQDDHQPRTEVFCQTWHVSKEGSGRENPLRHKTGHSGRWITGPIGDERSSRDRSLQPQSIKSSETSSHNRPSCLQHQELSVSHHHRVWEIRQPAAVCSSFTRRKRASANAPASQNAPRHNWSSYAFAKPRIGAPSCQGRERSCWR